METLCPIRDAVIWFKHIESPALRRHLEILDSEEEIELSVEGKQGRWARMRTGRDGRMVDGIRPQGLMKDLWMHLYETRRGDVVRIAIPESDTTADSWTRAVADLMPEWLSEADEAAFRDL